MTHPPHPSCRRCRRAGRARPEAQGEWPNRTVRVIVPWPPGGSTDVLVRIYCEQLQPHPRPDLRGREPRPAPAATSASTRREGDAGRLHHGHRLTLGRLAHQPVPLCPPALRPAARLAAGRDAWELPNVAGRPAPAQPVANSLPDFIAWAKAQRGGITYGSPGVGTTAHLLGRAVHRPPRLRGHACALPRRGADHPGDAVGRSRLRARQPRQLHAGDPGRPDASAWRSPARSAGRPCPTCRPWPRPACRTSSSTPGSASSSPPARRRR